MLPLFQPGSGSVAGRCSGVGTCVYEDCRERTSIVGPVTIQLGDMVFQEMVYVAPIEDCRLLGLDFLKKHGATIDIVGATMCFNGQVVPMSQEGRLVEARGANVTVARTVIIPTNSVAMLSVLWESQ